MVISKVFPVDRNLSFGKLLQSVPNLSFETEKSMRAIQFRLSISGFIIVKLLGKFYRPIHYSRLSPIAYVEVAEPTLPDENWVKIRTLYGGICSTDMAGVMLKHRTDSYMSAFLSFPIGVGHEAIGYITEVGSNVTGMKVGDRVTMDPSLSCVTRGISPMCKNCQAGNYSSCTNFAEGNLPPGTGVGGNSRTGGGWGEYFVAHKERVYVIPESISDETGLFIEPFCCALHSVMKLTLKDEDTILVFGAGTIGLCTIAALRILGFSGRILVAAKYPFQQEAARQMGADVIVPIGGRQLFDKIAELTDGKVYKARFSSNCTLMGGVDVVFDWVGNTQTITDSLKLLKSGGDMILGGVGNPRNVDWTALWFQEDVVHGTSGHATETYEGKRLTTFELAIRLLSESGLSLDSLLTHTFPLDQYGQALRTLLDKKTTGAIKVAFKFPKGEADDRKRS